MFEVLLITGGVVSFLSTGLYSCTLGKNSIDLADSFGYMVFSICFTICVIFASSHIAESRCQTVNNVADCEAVLTWKPVAIEEGATK